MSKKKQPDKPSEIPQPDKDPEIKPGNQPEEEPGIIPEEEPSEPSPGEIPLPQKEK